VIIRTSSEELGNVAQWCAKELNIDTYDVKVIINECCLKHDNAWGWTYDLAFEDEIDVELDKNLSTNKKILTLCHEMVHVRQVCRGDENFCEVEANKLERELYEQYKTNKRIL